MGKLISILFMLNFLMISCTSDIKELEPEYELTADDINQAYNENPARANEMYKNKVIRVIGKVSFIKEDKVALNCPYVCSVNCYMSEKCISELSQIDEGQKISVKGICKGVPTLMVELHNCTIEKIID